jgi:hypothetical protein
MISHSKAGEWRSPLAFTHSSTIFMTTTTIALRFTVPLLAREHFPAFVSLRLEIFCPSVGAEERRSTQQEVCLARRFLPQWRNRNQ